MYRQNPFEALSESIVYQQLHGRAAAAIFARMVRLFHPRRFPRPEDLLEVPDERLRSAGLSRGKIAAIRDLAAKTIDGTVPRMRDLKLLSDDEIVERLSAVRGIGRWTAEMFLLFQLRRLDVWPVDDFGVRKGYAAVHHLGKPPTPRELRELGDVYRPWRTVAAWYCWRAAETVVPQA